MLPELICFIPLDILDIPCQGTAAAQQLPRSLRRRAVSHNVNRLPRRLRSRHLGERAKSDNSTEGTGAQKKPKRPSRKYRRRPSNLLLEYERRQKEAKGGKWLETHIWHAKRFHMVTPAHNVTAKVVDNVRKSDKEAPTPKNVFDSPSDFNGRWGYKLADFSNEKGFRACYRSVAKNCIMQDVSYLGCIELSGRRCDLKAVSYTHLTLPTKA